MRFFDIWLIIVVYLCDVNDTTPRIFDTTIISENTNTFDCLIRSDLANNSIEYKDAIIELNDFNEILKYCRRSSFSSSRNLTTITYPSFTFDQLRSMNVTHQQLYQWNAPIDLIEEYIAEEQTGLFVNCSNTKQFGSLCEYTFNSDKKLIDIIHGQFRAKENIPRNLSLYTNGTCYEMNNTDCESLICLDWREICDGKIDCKNGYDERYCQALEMNECNPLTERRCYDGQCIDDPLDIRYLDNTCLESYSWRHNGEFLDCYKKHEIRCENQKCPKLFFSCGDGYCYDGPSIGNRSCSTQRDQRYFEQMPTLSSMILFSHVIIYYNNVQPEYICYNETLCPYLSFDNRITTTLNNGLTCHAFVTFTNRTYDYFDEMLIDVKRLLRSCSLLPLDNNCSMFQCHDGSKCLSYHRLSDGREDCTNGEDEHQINVCSHNLSGRFTCDNKTMCIPFQLLVDQKNDCIDTTDEAPLASALTRCNNPFSEQCHTTRKSDDSNVPFYYICNGLVECYSDSKNNTDESDCKSTEWPCDAYHLKCDNVWNCPDGHDELGCMRPNRASLYCNNIKHFCLQINTGKPMCLSTINADDGIIDCVGSFDERKFCRRKYPHEYNRRYRCKNSTQCITTESICDRKQDCPENDDETIACNWLDNRQRDCILPQYENYDGRSDLFCDLNDAKHAKLWELDNSLRMLEEIKKSLLTVEHRIKRQTIKNPDYHVIWSCNRGIYVQSTKDPEGFACFCPDYYYGNRCQYQRKRISIILQIEMLTAFNQQISTSIFVVLLVHTNQSNITIISHVQFMNILRNECDFGFNIQLLYPINEPYRSLTNNSVHIHMIDRQTLRHQKSWSFPLSFEFLPVQHLFKRLDLPELGTNIESRKISLPYNTCTSCSNHSLCIGHDISLDRDICICPPNYDGRRCLLPFNPCTNISCNGHGTCQPTGISYDLDNQFICLCDVGWVGRRCQKSYYRIDLSLDHDLTFLSSTTPFLHVIEIIPGFQRVSQDIYSKRFPKETLNLTFILERSERLPYITFIQFYKHQRKFDYYLLSYYKPIEERLKNLLLDNYNSSKKEELIKFYLFSNDTFANELRQYYPLSIDSFNETLIKNRLFFNYTFIQTLSKYYSLSYPNRQVGVTNFQIKVHSSHRCRPIKELFNSTILSQSDIRRVKNYQQPCQQRYYHKHRLLCFYDNDIMCICRDDNSTHCFNFRKNLIACDNKWCHDRGMCVKDSEFCATYSQCICEQCAYGSYCQFSTEGYTLSLDGIIGSHILLNISIFSQPSKIIRTAIILISTIVVLGIVLNFLSIITFIQHETHRVGCGLYLLISSIIGLLTMIILISKLFLLLMDDRSNTGCSIVEFLLKWCPTTCEWLNACVAFERTIAIKLKTKYSRSKSKEFAKFITPLILILIGFISMPELFFRRIITDEIDGRAWCVLTLNKKQPELLTMYTILNIFSFIIPLIINLSSGILIILITLESKQKIKRTRRYSDLIRVQMFKYKHILIAPILLGCLSFPRLILMFIFVCTKLDRYSIRSLFVYLIGFLPSMATIFAFVWPSEVYCSALVKSINTIIHRM